jgi:hypothetical protein
VVEIDKQIVLYGMASLVAIETMLLICDRDTSSMTSIIVGAICLASGIMIKSPIIDNKSGVLKW